LTTPAVVGDTGWAEDLDAVVAAVAVTCPQATIHDRYPVQGAYLDLGYARWRQRPGRP
jgi:hypothetical protein